MIQDNIQLVDDRMDKAVSRFLDGIKKSEGGMFNELLAIARKLQVVNGDITQSQKNLRLLRELRTRIQNQVLNDAYRERSAKFIGDYDTVAKLNNGYFKAIEAAFNPNRQVYRQVLRSAKDATFESLLGAGINEQVVEPVMNIVSDSITNGATWENMVDELRVFIKGNEETLGRLERYTKQISTDAINQLNANYNQSIATDLGLDWYYYSGGVRKTSRPFCKKYSGKWFHKKEVEDFGKGEDLDGSKLCTGSFCNGRVKGTNASSIFRYRGGYNCRHIFKPSDIDGVPKNVIKRNIDKGYYKVDNANATFKEADTLKGAEQFALKNNLVKRVSYDGLDLKFANSMNKEMLRLSKKYENTFTNQLVELKSHRIGAFGDANVYGEVRISKFPFESQKNIKDIFIKDITSVNEKTKLPWNIGTKEEHVFTHEFGHQVDFNITRQLKILRDSGKITDDEFSEAWWGNKKFNHANYIKGSDYAKHNASESFAEAFVEINTQPKSKWSESAQKYNSYLDQLNKKYGINL